MSTQPKSTLADRWWFRFALRDGYASRRALLLVGVSITLALASMVALLGFRSSVQSQISANARALVGADVLIKFRGVFSEQDKEVLASFPGRQASQLGLASMAYVPESGRSRLIYLLAVSESFPLYGRLETQPQDAARLFHKNESVLIDRSLALQLDIGVGQRLSIGSSEFTVEGLVTKAPGSSDMTAAIAPRVYLPEDLLANTELIQVGSRVRSTRYFASG